MGPEHFSQEDRLRMPGEEKVQGDLISVCKYSMGENEEKRSRLFSMVPSDRTGGYKHKLKHQTRLSQELPSNLNSSVIL